MYMMLCVRCHLRWLICRGHLLLFETRVDLIHTHGHVRTHRHTSSWLRLNRHKLEHAFARRPDVLVVVGGRRTSRLQSFSFLLARGSLHLLSQLGGGRGGGTDGSTCSLSQVLRLQREQQDQHQPAAVPMLTFLKGALFRPATVPRSEPAGAGVRECPTMK